MLHDVGRAVGYAHTRGVIHRDLTPDNVMIERPSGRAIVMDFGIARVDARPDDVRKGYVLGTAPFICPERVTGHSQGDERSDVYALGATAYYAVTGRPPFEGTTTEEILRQHVVTTAPTLHLRGADLDLTFAHAVSRCLDKDPARRFQDGDALADALAEAPEIRGRELPVPLQAFLERLRRYSAATRGISVLVAAAVLLALDGVRRTDWLSVAGGAGFLVLAAAGAGVALLPTVRRLLRAGHTRVDLVHALSVDRERDREVRVFQHGRLSPTPGRVARWIGYGGLGVVGLGAALSFVPIIPPEVGLLAMLYGVVLALVASTVGAVWARRRLNRPGELWLKFWNSRAGAWVTRLAAAGLGSERAGARLPQIGDAADDSDELDLDDAAARRIWEWVQGDDRREIP
jgi:serine/threonine-protein kinase